MLAPADAPRMPGVTIRKSGPHSVRIDDVSCGEATTPSIPAALAMPASARTCSSTPRVTPVARSVGSSMLVSTVTPIISGSG